MKGKIKVKMLVSGHRYKCTMHPIPMYYRAFCRAVNCPTNNLGIDIEPGLTLLEEECSKGKIIRLDEQTANRLKEFAKSQTKTGIEPNETSSYPDLINRLLEIATKKLHHQ